jgi:hypothetical protein
MAMTAPGTASSSGTASWKEKAERMPTPNTVKMRVDRKTMQINRIVTYNTSSSIATV